MKQPAPRVPEPTDAETLSPDFKAQLLALSADRPAPTRRALARQTLGLTIASWAIALTVFVIAGGPRIEARPTMLVMGTVLGTAAAAAAGLWAVLGRGDSTLGRARHVLLPIIIGSPAAILGWKYFWSAQFEGGLDAWATRPGFRCLALSLSIAISPLVTFAIARRRSDPQRPILTGFAAGLAIGCAACVLTDLWCPVAYLPHLLLGHLLPIALLGVLGAWLGSEVVAMKTQ